MTMILAATLGVALGLMQAWAWRRILFAQGRARWGWMACKSLAWPLALLPLAWHSPLAAAVCGLAAGASMAVYALGYALRRREKPCRKSASCQRNSESAGSMSDGL